MCIDIIIDGANISHIKSTEIVAARIEKAIDELSKFGLEAHAVFPQYIYERKNKNKKIIDFEVIDALISSGKLSLVDGNDDVILISLAYDDGALILSNDSFSDHKSKSWCTSEVRKVIDNRRIKFSFVKDRFVIPLEDRCKITKCQNEKKTGCNEEINIPNFKDIVTNNLDSLCFEEDILPEPVNKLIEIVDCPKKHRLSDVSSKIKTETGYSINDVFGNSKKASKFLEKCGYEISRENNQFYVTGGVAV